MQQVRLELDSNVRRIDNGTALLGGSPFRLVRLSGAGSRLLDRWLVGAEEAATPGEEELRRNLIRSGLVHPVPDARAELPSVAVVIPVFDDPAGLDELLRGLRRELPAEPVVVVDDASKESDAIATVAKSHDVELTRHHENRGPAAARNTGWNGIGRPEVVLFIDADVVPTAGALRTMLSLFEDPDVAVVAPRVRPAPGADRIAAYEADNSPLDMGADPALVFPGTRISYVPSAVIAVRSDVLDAAGGFDTTMRFGEDVDLVWRLIDDGHVVRYEPAAIFEHRNRSSIAGFARQRFSYGSSAGALADRHGSKVAPLQMPAPVVGATLFVLFGQGRWRLLATLAAAAGTWPLASKLEGKVDSPMPEAARLTAMSHRYAVQGLATAATRSWAPLLMLGRRSRRALLAALVVPAMLDWLRTRPATDPLTHIGLRALDHGSYCAGVWAGALRSRSVAALLPSVRFASRHDD